MLTRDMSNIVVPSHTFPRGLVYIILSAIDLTKLKWQDLPEMSSGSPSDLRLSRCLDGPAIPEIMIRHLDEID